MMILLLIILFVIVVSIPIGLSILIYKFIKRKGFDKKFRVIALIPILIFAYLIFTAIYPSNEFYEEDFSEVTTLKFPENGIIKYKSASYPDQFGDYTSCFLAEFEKEYLEKLKRTIIEKGFVEKSGKIGCDELTYIENQIKDKKYIKEFSKEVEGGKIYYIGFLNDNKSVVIERTSW
jgi:hypothetical protein